MNYDVSVELASKLNSIGNMDENIKNLSYLLKDVITFPREFSVVKEKDNVYINLNLKGTIAFKNEKEAKLNIDLKLVKSNEVIKITTHDDGYSVGLLNVSNPDMPEGYYEIFVKDSVSSHLEVNYYDKAAVETYEKLGSENQPGEIVNSKMFASLGIIPEAGTSPRVYICSFSVENPYQLIGFITSNFDTIIESVQEKQR